MKKLLSIGSALLLVAGVADSQLITTTNVVTTNAALGMIFEQR